MSMNWERRMYHTYTLKRKTEQSEKLYRVKPETVTVEHGHQERCQDHCQIPVHKRTQSR